MGGHKEDPLSPILGEEGPGDGGSFPSRAANGGVGENQCNHSSGGPGDHGRLDGTAGGMQDVSSFMSR